MKAPNRPLSTADDVPNDPAPTHLRLRSDSRLGWGSFRSEPLQGISEALEKLRGSAMGDNLVLSPDGRPLEREGTRSLARRRSPPRVKARARGSSYPIEVENTSVGVAPKLELLYREEGDRIWRAVFAYAGDREVASDAVAEAFAQAIRRGDAIRDLRAWVWKAAFKIAAGELESRRFETSIEVEPAYEMELKDAELAEALGRLSEQQRAVVILHYYADRPLIEIAATLSISPTTAAVHAHRGRLKLRELLTEVPDV